MISKKTKYALKALTLLGRRYNRGPILISDLAREERIPKKFLELILLALKNGGILQSRKGKGGGYYLGRHPRDISMGMVIRLLEGSLAPVPCITETPHLPCGECVDERTCGVRLVMKDVQDSVTRVLDTTTLAQVLERIEKLEEEKRGILTYCI